MKTLILIPSRLSATRLPGKPLLKIKGKSVISHVVQKAEQANIGEVFVATEDKEIIADVNQNGGKAILTKNIHKTGTDRIYEALNKLGKSDIELVMNLQGDEPLMDVEDIVNLHNQMIKSNSQLGTLASKIENESFFKSENIVKVITTNSFEKSEFPEALDFSRKLLNVSENTYQHLGIYCYQLKTLENFVSLKQSGREIKNRLEQLRALDNNIKINVAQAKSSPIGVDTEEDFLAIKKIMEYKS
tara:strand:- start:4898 stop:5632 length:735 start_codon:yes stop_codon:yes gene_type:complete